MVTFSLGGIRNISEYDILIAQIQFSKHFKFTRGIIEGN